MLSISLYVSALLHLLLLPTTATTAPPYTPTYYVLLSCGSSTNTTSLDGRNWDGDVHSKFSLSNTDPNTSSASTASQQNPSVPQVPFMTARIFHSPFTYTFPVTAGPKFLRLYFYPTTYSGLDPSQSFFSVTSNHHTLLSNFSAFLTVTSTQQIDPIFERKQPVASIVKEFIINNFQDNQTLLNITFSPSPNSYAFINGIELLSMPDNLYAHDNDEPITLAGVDYKYSFDENTVLETLYRLNVGGNTINAQDDTGMFRTWENDEMYIFGQTSGLSPHRNVTIQYTAATPPYTAPEILYTKARTMGNLSLNFNLTWTFGVDTGFYYLVRLHFCEFTREVTKVNQRAFTIYLNNQTAEEAADVIFWSGGANIPVYKDYVVWVPDVGGRRIKQDLWLAMHPNLHNGPVYKDAILNGLELFKLNQSDGSLAGPNPEIQATETPDTKLPVKSTGKRSSLIWIVVGGVVGGIIAMSIVGFVLFRRRRRVKDFGTSVTKSSWVPISVVSRSTKSSKTPVLSLPSDLCRHFPLAEIKSATRNFDDYFVIGTGGFGNVYKGYIDNDTAVAIKRLNPESSQGAHEFQTEIIMLSKLRYRHLVSLIGYCDDEGEMILVYDYMAHGTLRDHLYKSNNPPLSWNQRLQISIGAARGLHYLHTGVKQPIIHRDVKSTNILLDEKWVAKVSDFGLSKMGPTELSKGHVSTVVKGSFGYVDPEYYRLRQLTDKSDVYSFGVVLLELLCARSPINPRLPKEQVNLAEWGRYCYRKGTVDRIVDPNLRGKIAPECLRKFAEIADSCLRDHGIERPSMNDVVWGLEFALQLQEAADRNINDGDEFRTNHIIGGSLVSPSVPLRRYGEATTTDDDDDVFSGSTEHATGSKSSGVSTKSSGGQGVDKFKIENVFSEIMNPKGR